MRTTREDLENISHTFFKPGRNSGQTLKRNLIADALTLHDIVEAIGKIKIDTNCTTPFSEGLVDGQQAVLDRVLAIIKDNGDKR